MNHIDGQTICLNSGCLVTALLVSNVAAARVAKLSRTAMALSAAAFLPMAFSACATNFEWSNAGICGDNPNILKLGKTFSWRTLGVAAGGMGVAAAGAYLIELGCRPLQSYFQVQDSITVTIQSATSLKSRVLMISTVAIAIPVAEEVLVRWPCIGGREHSPVVLPIAVGIVFGLMHCWPAPNAVYATKKVVQIGIFGVALSLVAHEAESIWPSVLLHIAWNTYCCCQLWG